MSEIQSIIRLKFFQISDLTFFHLYLRFCTVWFRCIHLGIM